LSSTARCVQRVCSTTPVERDFNDIKSRYEAATDPNATRYDAAPLKLLDFTKLESAETYSLLGQAIISTADNAYSRFWQNLNAMDWVNTGHTHYSENAAGSCPYCSRELPTDTSRNNSSPALTKNTLKIALASLNLGVNMPSI